MTQGCLPSVPTSSTTLAAFACEGIVYADGHAIPVSQPSASVGSLTGGDGAYWLVLHPDRTSTVSGWNRQSGTHYLWQKSATQPALTGLALLAQVTVASGVISTVDDMRVPASYVRSTAYDVTDPLYGGVADDATDIAPAINTAVRAAVAQKQRRVRVPAGRYLLASGITIPRGIELAGDGWAAPGPQAVPVVPSPTQALRGTWLHITSTAFVPINITGTGTAVKGIAFDHDQPTPTTGWAPYNYPYTITITSSELSDAQVYTLDIELDDLFFYKASRGIHQVSVTDYPSGHIRIRNIFGQFFNNTFTFDKMTDPFWISTLHSWAYWSGHADVLAYTDNNLVVVGLLATIAGYIENLSVYSARLGIAYLPNAFGITGALFATNVSFDRTIAGLYSNQNGATGQLVNFRQAGALAEGSSTVMMPGFEQSTSIFIEGSNNVFHMVNVETVVNGGSCVTNLGAGSMVNLHNISCANFNYSGTGAGLNYNGVGAGGVITGDQRFVNGNGAPALYIGTYTKQVMPGGAVFSPDFAFATSIVGANRALQFVVDGFIEWVGASNAFLLNSPTGVYDTGGVKKYLCIQDGVLTTGATCP